MGISLTKSDFGAADAGGAGVTRSEPRDCLFHPDGWSLSTAALLRRFPRIIYNRASEYINPSDSIYYDHKTTEMREYSEDMTTSIDENERIVI